MSVVISNCDWISKNSTNTSTSKQLYTFPQGERFLHYKDAENSTVQYGSPTGFRTGHTLLDQGTFGVSDRPNHLVSKEKKGKPGPGAHMLPSSFVPRVYAFEKPAHSRNRSAYASRSLELKNGKMFGVGRDAFDKVVS